LDFSELLRRAREGDRGAVSELYERYRAQVERAARRGRGSRLRVRFDTDDIAQSVFADLLREIPDFEDRGEPAFRAWLSRKVGNKLASKARRQSRADGLPREVPLGTDSALDPGAHGPGPPGAAVDREERDRIAALLGTLDPSQSEVIGLRIDEGLGWEEVASRLGLPSADAARMRFVRAVTLLRERWTRT
jgi:RNA polymerase sigma-70 factor (ECF subfamily)